MSELEQKQQQLSNTYANTYLQNLYGASPTLNYILQQPTKPKTKAPEPPPPFVPEPPKALDVLRLQPASEAFQPFIVPREKVVPLVEHYCMTNYGAYGPFHAWVVAELLSAHPLSRVCWAWKYVLGRTNLTPHGYAALFNTSVEEVLKEMKVSWFNGIGYCNQTSLPVAREGAPRGTTWGALTSRADWDEKYNEWDYEMRARKHAKETGEERPYGRGEILPFWEEVAKLPPSLNFSVNPNFKDRCAIPEEKLSMLIWARDLEGPKPW